MSAMRKVLMVFLALGFISLSPAMSYADGRDYRSGHGDRHGDRHDGPSRNWNSRHDNHNWHRHNNHSSFDINFRFAPAPRHYFYERPIFVPRRVITYYEPPVTVIQPVAAPVLTAPIDAGTMDEFTINVPNTNGTYTSVLIRRSGTGFVGPQGEFYYEFPPVAQLKVVYGL